MNRWASRTGCWLLLLAAGAVPSASAWVDLPVVEARVDTDQVTLGDPIQLALTLRYRRGEEPVWLPIGEWLQKFSARSLGRKGPVDGENGVEEEYRFELRLFELGHEQVPALSIGFASAGGDTLVRASQPIDIEVVSARDEGEEEPRDIKPPVAIAGGIPLWLVVLLAVLVLLIFGALFWRWRRKRERAEEAIPPPEPIDHVAEFVRIAGMGLVEKGDFKRYYSLLADNLRLFLERELEVEAMEQTTQEIASSLDEIELSDGIVRDLLDYLNFADLVKFARHIPDIDRARRAPEVGIGIVRAAEKWWRERQAQSLAMTVAPGEETPAEPS